MDSLMDYIQWMGDFPISATGFRDADALILCTLSYIDFSPVFSDDKTHTERHKVSDCLEFLENGRMKVMVTGSDSLYLELLSMAASSKRFGQLDLSDYCNLFRKNPPLQFSAVCFHDDEDFSFLAYRGTDNSLAGWKEDFMISFTRTRSQDLALQYAQKVISAGRRWYIGGHSKGSNLALYTACLLEDEKWRAVEHIYLLDGPGLCPEVLDSSLTERIDKKSTQVAPRFCVIGKILAPKIRDTRIIQSSAPDILQHPIITWGIDHGNPALAKEHDSGSLLINEVINAWICNIGNVERIIFTEELFDALTADGNETIDQIHSKGLEGLEAIVLRLIQSSGTTKAVLSELQKQLLKANLDRLGNKFSNLLDKIGKLRKDTS